MCPATYLVFGDLHGHVLPAFRLAQVWSHEHGVPLDGLLQVGDLGDSRFDSKRRKQSEWLQDGRQLLPRPSEDADITFAGEPSSRMMWFTAGNHEDFELLKKLERRSSPGTVSFPVDAYGKLRCIRDGCVAELGKKPESSSGEPETSSGAPETSSGEPEKSSGGLKVGALWGIDDKAPRARKQIPPRARIRRRSIKALSGSTFDVLLTHESPRDAVLPDNGSEEIGSVIRTAQPAFAFFGHYHCTGRQIEGPFGKTRVYHLCHMELSSRAEERSVGVLTWEGGKGDFSYLDPDWLHTFTRHNWKHR